MIKKLLLFLALFIVVSCTKVERILIPQYIEIPLPTEEIVRKEEALTSLKDREKDLEDKGSSMWAVDANTNRYTIEERDLVLIRNVIIHQTILSNELLNIIQDYNSLIKEKNKKEGEKTNGKK